MFFAEISEQKEQILSSWFEEFLKAYPPEAAVYFRNTDNSFGNPVGYTAYQSMLNILDALLKAEDPLSALDDLIHIQASQAFLPSQALAFILALKNIVGSNLSDAAYQSEEFQNFNSSVDNLLLAAFDKYLACREKIFDLKVKEATRQMQRILERWEASLAEAGPAPKEFDSKI